MFTFGGVDKAQNRFADLFEFDMVERTWSEVMTTGEPPTPRTFHKSVVHDGHMYILGGFDGYRQNDTYRVCAAFFKDPQSTPTGLAKFRSKQA